MCRLILEFANYRIGRTGNDYNNDDDTGDDDTKHVQLILVVLYIHSSFMLFVYCMLSMCRSNSCSVISSFSLFLSLCYTSSFSMDRVNAVLIPYAMKPSETKKDIAIGTHVNLGIAEVNFPQFLMGRISVSLSTLVTRTKFVVNRF